MHVYRITPYYITGEGTQHVLKVAVNGAPSDIFARDLGRFVTNSNLVKCAMAGCDPNVGRIIGTYVIIFIITESRILHHFHYLISVTKLCENN